MLRGFILSVHILLALMIIGLVLMQRGKGAEAGAGFGSGASGTVFGARGTATLFSKLTAVFAALFFVTSLTLAYMGTRSGRASRASVLRKRAAQARSGAHRARPPAAAPAPTSWRRSRRLRARRPRAALPHRRHTAAAPPPTTNSLESSYT